MKQLTIISEAPVTKDGHQFQQFDMEDSGGNRYTTFRAVTPKAFLKAHVEFYRMLASKVEGNDNMKEMLTIVSDMSQDILDIISQ